MANKRILVGSGTTAPGTPGFRPAFPGETLVDGDGKRYVAADGSVPMTARLDIESDAGGVRVGAGNDAEFYYDGTYARLKSGLIVPSDLIIDCGTEKTLVLAESVWDDLRVPLTAGKTGASNPPTFAQVFDNGSGSVGVYAWSFAAEAVVGNEEQIWFAAQLPHKYKEGTDICPHIHWTPAATGAEGEFVKWGLEYVWASIGSTFGDTTIVTTDASTAATATTQGDSTLTVGKHYRSEFASIAGVNKTLSSMLLCRLFRNSSHATDDLAAAAFGLEFDFHYEVDTLGSRQENTK